MKSRKRVVCVALACLVTALLAVAVPLDARAENVDATGNFSYEEYNGKATITGYLGDDAEVVIPEKIDGLVVDSIGAEAFRGNEHITSVTMPDTIEAIAELAFYRCSNLANVELSAELTTIASEAFGYCDSLKEIVIPRTLVSTDNPFIGSGVEKASLEDGMTTIPDRLFAIASNLKSVVLPDTLVEIGSQAFYACHNLSSVSLPDSLLSIGSHAFSGCSSLKEVIIPASTSMLGYGVFADCSSLTKVSIGSHVSCELGTRLFSNCSVLREVRMSPWVIEANDTTLFSNCPLVTVYGYAGSSAESIASTCGVNFSAVNDPLDLSLATVSLPEEMLFYKGEPVEPTGWNVTIGTISLVEGVDYEVSYKNNNHVGTATATFTALKEPFTGSTSQQFSIEDPADYAEYVISMDDDYWTFSVELSYRANVTWKVSDSTLASLGDFRQSTIDLGSFVSISASVDLYPKAPGYVELYALADGEVVETFTIRIEKGTRIDLSGAEIRGLEASYDYAGGPVCPVFSVVLDGAELESGTDYITTYDNNDGPGVATLRISGVGGYRGEIVRQFQIVEPVPDPDPEPTPEPEPEPEPTPDPEPEPTPEPEPEPTPDPEPEPTPDPDPEPEPTPDPEPAVETQAMHRLYNKWTGEHFYTASATERDSLVSVGWTSEGVGWVAPTEGDEVYRLYNPYVKGGDHHYTLDVNEYEALKEFGWNQEGVGWRSAPKSGGEPVYRQYNPYAETGTHNYTTDAHERDVLISLGWRNEGIGWYAVSTK